jgi:hypothetical protein
MDFHMKVVFLRITLNLYFIFICMFSDFDMATIQPFKV